jgi:hypothetical protein
MWVYSLLTIALLFGVAQPSQADAPPITHKMPAHSLPRQSATVAMEVRDNRVFVPLQITGPNGKKRTALFWIDSGGDTIFFSGPLAHALGLEKSGPSFQGMGNTPSHMVNTPHLAIEAMAIDLNDVSAAVSESKNRNAFAGVEAEGFLPATVLKKYDVVFDYPAHRFTLATSGVIAHHGVPVPLSVNPTTGFARIELSIAGRSYGFMLDTGAAYTGVSQGRIDQWMREHPSWPHSVGAVGAANMVGKSFDVGNELIRLPELSWGPVRLQNVGMVSRQKGLYENVISKDMTAPIVGALSGNVLRLFRLDIDYPAGLVYLDQRNTDSANDLDSVGVIVQVKDDGSVIISGVVKRNGLAEVDGVEPGDQLLRVDGRWMAGASIATVDQALSGAVKEKHQLTVRRGERIFSVPAEVRSHP